MSIPALEDKMGAVHPGEILREEFLAPLDMSASALAIELRVPAARITEIVREKRGISVDTACRLARYFRMSADFWLGLQADYDLATLPVAQKKEYEAIRPLERITEASRTRL